MVDLLFIIGLLIPVIVAVFYTVQKQLTSEYSPLSVSIAMHIIPTLLLSCFLIIYPYSPNKTFILLAGLSGFINAISFVLLSKAYSKDALSAIAPLRGLTPIIVAIFEPLFFTTVVYNSTLVFASLLVAGGIYITFYESNLVQPVRNLSKAGPLAGVGSAIVIAFAVIIDRTVLVSYTIHPLTYTFYISSFTLSCLSIYTIVSDKTVQLDLLYSVQSLKIGVLRTATLALGLGLLSLVTGSIMNIIWQLHIVVTVIIGGKLIGEKHIKRKIIGSLVIIAAVLLTVQTL